MTKSIKSIQSLCPKTLTSEHCCIKFQYYYGTNDWNVSLTNLSAKKI